MRDLPKKMLQGLIMVYSYAISPLTPAKCRFHPTCSAYAMDALEKHGVFKGGILAVKRLSKCHPWHKGAMIDPVPASIDWADIIGYNSRKADNDKNGCCGRH